ncbi:GNAT family N-acetyltransferase [Simiduia litorea]|uniref:GNAT family N-acetyltransferase n=1 Tax=Simiduia litorea TaxID=1435348 RepID=UPI0036F3D26F
MVLRQFEVRDRDALLRLNEQSVNVLSPMDQQRFDQLSNQSSLILVAEQENRVLGFLIGFTDGSQYDSKNYRWFSDRLKAFFYVDRIVIAAEARSQGLGQRFYSAIEIWAQEHKLHWLAAEIDIEPANPASLSFHQRQGFNRVGQQGIKHKQVSLLVKAIG